MRSSRVDGVREDFCSSATLFQFGRREIGHLHHTGEGDLPFPTKIYDELIATGRAKPHAAGFARVVSYVVREPGDVPGVDELFRMHYERAKAVVRAGSTPSVNPASG